MAGSAGNGVDVHGRFTGSGNRNERGVIYLQTWVLRLIQHCGRSIRNQLCLR